MPVDIVAMIRNYSKEDFVGILQNLFVVIGWLTIGIDYLHNMLTVALLIRFRSIFQFNRNHTSPVVIVH